MCACIKINVDAQMYVCVRVCASADSGDISVDYVTCIHFFVTYINYVNLDSVLIMCDLHTILFLLSPRLPLSHLLPLILLSSFHPLSECSDENPCEGLSRHATFDNFGMAFLTLFRVSTGDNWNGIMKVISLPLLCCVGVVFKEMNRQESPCLCLCICVCVSKLRL